MDTKHIETVDNKLNVTMDVTNWDTLTGVVTDAMTWAWIVNGVQHARYDHDHNETIATVTLTVDQWHGVIDDISTIINGLGMVSVNDIDTNMARLFNVRDAIELALRYDVRNG